MVDARAWREQQPITTASFADVDPEEPGYLEAASAAVAEAAQAHDVELRDGWLAAIPALDRERLSWLEVATAETVAWQESTLARAGYELFHHAPGTYDYDAAIDDIRVVRFGATTVVALRSERRDLIATHLAPASDCPYVASDTRFDPPVEARQCVSERNAWVQQAVLSTFAWLTSGSTPPLEATALSYDALSAELHHLTDIEQHRADDVATGRYRAD